jgi:hypothetical protein
VSTSTRGEPSRVVANRIGRGTFALLLVVGLAYLWFSPPAPRLPPAQAPGVLDRALTDRLLDLARIAIVVFGAFIAGGIAQRIWMGDFAVKIAGFELPRLVSEASEQVLNLVNEKLALLREDSKETASALDTNVRALRALRRRVDTLETRAESAEGVAPPAEKP